MEENIILDTIERYLRGEMLPEEVQFFEHLRKTNPSIDQMVVEHSIFLNQLGRYGEIKELKSTLKEIHTDLAAAGEIHSTSSPKVISLWKKYKRVVGVAASIAGITALGISGLISYISPKVNEAKVEYLSRKINDQDRKLNNINDKLNQARPASSGEGMHFTSGGTGFLIDGKGYLLTNEHVVRNATQVEVQNSQGQYHARIVYINPITDLALLKIDDEDFKPYASLPYGISKSGSKLGEELFTLGYPRDEIVYGKGYVSAKTGFRGDTMAYQITIPANPGNSGTPVLNKDGEVVGVVRASQQDAQGVVFAIRSKNIFRVLDEIRSDSTLQKNDSTLSHIKVPLVSNVRGLDREQQIEKIQDCIFIVKSGISQ